MLEIIFVVDLQKIIHKSRHILARHCIVDRVEETGIFYEFFHFLMKHGIIVRRYVTEVYILRVHSYM